MPQIGSWKMVLGGAFSLDISKVSLLTARCQGPLWGLHNRDYILVCGLDDSSISLTIRTGIQIHWKHLKLQISYNTPNVFSLINACSHDSVCVCVSLVHCFFFFVYLCLLFEIPKIRGSLDEVWSFFWSGGCWSNWWTFTVLITRGGVLNQSRFAGINSCSILVCETMLECVYNQHQSTSQWLDLNAQILAFAAFQWRQFGCKWYIKMARCTQVHTWNLGTSSGDLPILGILEPSKFEMIKFIQ